MSGNTRRGSGAIANEISALRSLQSQATQNQQIHAKSAQKYQLVFQIFSILSIVLSAVLTLFSTLGASYELIVTILGAASTAFAGISLYLNAGARADRHSTVSAQYSVIADSVDTAVDTLPTVLENLIASRTATASELSHLAATAPPIDRDIFSIQIPAVVARVIQPPTPPTPPAAQQISPTQ